MPSCKADPMFGDKQIGQVQKGGRIAAVADLSSFLSHQSRDYLCHISTPVLSGFHC